MTQPSAQLSEGWRAAPADPDLALVFAAPDFDDGDWAPVSVPGHWRSVPALADSDGPVLYRTSFETGSEAPELPGSTRRSWLVFDGIFYESDVWLDGAYVGDTKGYFFPHEFEVSELLAARREHVLAVDVSCAREDDLTAKRNITGVFQHWDCFDPEWNPGGIWRPVHLEHSGAVRLRHARVLCRDANPETGTLFLRAVLDTPEARPVELVTSVRTPGARHEHVETRSLASGENRVEWTVNVPAPPLWWPHALGDQPLAEVELAVRLDDGSISDRRRRTVGFRSLRLRNWVLEVNGERLFVKGSNQGPTRMALAEATPDELARDVELAVEANLDMLRLHAHVSRPELYEAADRAGLLLWQDFPLQWGYARSIRQEARRQAREAVDLLAHHPSVVVWCGHNEPLALDIDADAFSDPAKQRRIALRGATGMLLPSWNKTVLDNSIRRVLERSDPSRPVIPHSGVLPHPPQLDGTDSHLYFGWYWGDERDFPTLLRRWPRLARFVSEFGAQAVPQHADFCEPTRWPHLDWERLGHRHSLQRARFDAYVPPAEHETFDGWREATQRYQAQVIKHHIEALRRIKYRPTGGFLQFCFADGHPAVTWSVLDHLRAPKLGYETLRRACAPVIVVADRLPSPTRPGSTLELEVHVVNDRRAPVEGATVTARLSWDAEVRTWCWAGDVPADECTHVGTVRVAAPDHPGTLVLELELDGAGVTASNRYETEVVAPN